MHYASGKAAEIMDKHLTKEMEGERQIYQERVSAGVEQTSLEFASPALAQAMASPPGKAALSFICPRTELAGAGY